MLLIMHAYGALILYGALAYQGEHNGMAYWVIGLGWLMRVESPSPFTCKSFNAKLM